MHINKIIIALASVLFMSQVAIADEDWQPAATPTPVEDAVDNYWVKLAVFDRGDATDPTTEKVIVVVQLRKSDNSCAKDSNLQCREFQVVYDSKSTPAGETLMRQMNTSDFTTTSVMKTLMLRLQADGHLPSGSTGGTPDPTHTPVP